MFHERQTKKGKCCFVGVGLLLRQKTLADKITSILAFQKSKNTKTKKSINWKFLTLREDNFPLHIYVMNLLQVLVLCCRSSFIQKITCLLLIKRMPVMYICRSTSLSGVFYPTANPGSVACSNISIVQYFIGFWDWLHKERNVKTASSGTYILSKQYISIRNLTILTRAWLYLSLL